MGRLYTPKGNIYNESDPLGLLEAEKPKQDTPIHKFIRAEAVKKNLELSEDPTFEEIREYFDEACRKLIGMKVSFKHQDSFIKAKIIGTGRSSLWVEAKGTKDSYWIDFKEVLKLSNNYS